MPSDHGLTEFVKSVDTRYQAANPETIWLCEEPIKHLLAGEQLVSWINDQLRLLNADARYVGDWTATEAVIHRGRGWVASITNFDSPRRFIHALPFLGFYAPLDAALTGTRYRLPGGYRNDVFDPALRLEPAGSVNIGPRELLRLETDRYAYDFQLPQQQPVLRVATASVRPLEWLFSKSTLQAWQANDADLASTQLRVAAYVLGKIAHHSSVAPLRDLAKHPHHAVRWAAIQNLGRLSRTEALAKIRDAVNDPHPHVRRAAQKTLDQIDGRAR